MMSTCHSSAIWNFDNTIMAPTGIALHLEVDEFLHAEALNTVYDIDNAELFEDLDLTALARLYYQTLSDYLSRRTGRFVTVSATMARCVVAIYVNGSTPAEVGDDYIALQVLAFDSELLNDAVRCTLAILNALDLEEVS
jgi:hypothetical protein